MFGTLFFLALNCFPRRRSLSDSVHNATPLAPKGSVGNARHAAHGLQTEQRVGIAFVVEAVGATPTATVTIQGLKLGGDPAVAGDWVDIAYVDADSTLAASKAAIVVTAVGRTVKYLDGTALRFFESIAVNVTANTNVTFSANAYGE